MKTREQKLANTIDRHISVTANAGSGKTTVLVDRYLRLIIDNQNGHQPVDPKDITAITFTRLAATEMTERIISKINKKIDESKDENEILELSNIRLKLANANISTIHSFCGRILREYPIEAGVPPSFTELTGAEQVLIQQQSISEIIDDCLFQIDANDSTEYLDVKSLIFAIGGIKNLEEALNIIIDKRSDFSKAKQLYNDENNFEENFLKDFFEKIANFIRIFVEKFKRIVDNLSIPSDKNKKYFLKSELEIIISYAENILELSTLPNFIEAYNKITDALIHLKSILYDGNLRIFNQNNKFNVKFNNTICDDIYETELLFDTLKEFFNLIENSIYNEEQIKLAKILINLGDKAIDKYTQIKRKAEVLDFDDLIILTNELFQNNQDVVDSIRKKIKYLMVDEFQDTDSLQFSIIKKIMYDIDDEKLDYTNNLFIVGDPKQSIYGFRGADVNVFSKAKEFIKHANIRRINQGEIKDKVKYENEIITLYQGDDSSEKYGNISLTATFRTKPEISIFINKICNFAFDLEQVEDLFESNFTDKKNQHTNKVVYDNLITAKNANEFIEYFNNNDNDNDEFKNLKGNVVLLLTGVTNYEEETNDESEIEIDEIQKNNYIVNENELIADYIINNINSGKYNFKDFAVLCREKKYLGRLSVTLIERGIPFKNHSGGGFFNLPEILDIISLLKFISDNNDDVAFLTVLKSSFCGFDSTDLYIISQSKSKTAINYYSRMIEIVEEYKNKLPELSEDFIKRIEKYMLTLSIFKELIDFKLELTPALLITKAFEKFNWYKTIKNSPQYQRIKFNSEKLLDIARKSMEKGFKNLYDFVNELDFMKENYSKEPEATIISDDDQVNLMTIHASKGLEFKNVIILATNIPLSYKTGKITLDENYGINFTFNSLDVKNDKNIENVKSTLLKLSEISYKQKKIQEEKRVMYVAMTRAEENLIMTSNMNVNNKNEILNPRKNTILDYVLRACNIDLSYYANTEKNTLEFLTDTKLLSSSNMSFDVKEIKNYPLKIELLLKKDLNDNNNRFFKAQNSIAQSNPMNFPQALDSYIRGESISATRMMNYSKDQNDYTIRYILGFPDNFKVINDDNSDTNIEYFRDNIITPLDFGNSVHSIFEKINNWYKQNSIIEDELHTIIMNSLRNLSLKDNHDTIDEIKLIVKSVIASKVFDDYDLENSKSEFNVNYVIGENFINSIIDLVIQHKDGEYEIWDWKTNKINNNIKDLVDKYQHQMHFYAYFLYKLYPNQKTYKSKLLFVRQSINALDNNDWIVELHWTNEELKSYEENLPNEIKEITNYPFLNRERD